MKNNYNGRLFCKEKSESAEVIPYIRMRANCHKHMENWDMAVADLKKVVEENPGNKRDILILIKTLFDFGKFEAAVEGENFSLLPSVLEFLNI